MDNEMNDAMRKVVGRRRGTADGADPTPGAKAMNQQMRAARDRKTHVIGNRKDQS